MRLRKSSAPSTPTTGVWNDNNRIIHWIRKGRFTYLNNWSPILFLRRSALHLNLVKPAKWRWFSIELHARLAITIVLYTARLAVYTGTISVSHYAQSVGKCVAPSVCYWNRNNLRLSLSIRSLSLQKIPVQLLCHARGTLNILELCSFSHNTMGIHGELQCGFQNRQSMLRFEHFPCCSACHQDSEQLGRFYHAR